VNPQESDVRTAEEREADRQRRIWLTVDIAAPALAVAMAVITLGLIAHHGLSVWAWALVVATFVVAAVAVFRLIDAGPR
jgi:putative NIF3 family GTP cyclohydrolase 1 type 2